MKSETQGKLFGALAEAQGKFTTVTKSKTVNAGKYSYSYADLPSVLEMIRPILSAHGLSVMQPTCVVEGKTQLETVLAHSSGESISSVIPLSMQGNAQQIGSYITYMRRYALTSMLGIVTDTDDDGGAAVAGERTTHTTRETAPRDPQASPKQSAINVIADWAGPAAEGEKKQACIASAIEHCPGVSMDDAPLSDDQWGVVEKWVRAMIDNGADFNIQCEVSN